jgi:nucleotide-binding universal stress UspA family protein
MKILLAIDDSKFSQLATERLASQFHVQGADVLVLHVVEPLVFSTPPQMAAAYTPEMIARQREQFKRAEDTVARTAKWLRDAGFRQVETRVVETEIRTGILNVAEEWQADLITVGSHGRKGLKRFLLGSVAESVSHHAKCSVLVVKQAA